MPDGSRTGRRIRERRIALGMRQTTLAQSVGISPAYLNLIEHNHRRIAGKLLNQLAQALDLDADVLQTGARKQVLDGLQAALHRRTGEAEQADHGVLADFAERNPDWADLIVALVERVDQQEQTIAALADRLTHDPQLAASMHEILSVATAIRSTAGILATDQELDPDWQARFHRNLHEDSRRLSGSAQALVAHLDRIEDEENSADSADFPQDVFDHWLADRAGHIAELEAGGTQDVAQVLEAHPVLMRADAEAALARDRLTTYLEDARAVPCEALTQALNRTRDPLELARLFGQPFGRILRRFASLPKAAGLACGFVSCDASGTITRRREIDGFAIPRFGAACPIWPLFSALSQPNQPLYQRVRGAGYAAQVFACYAVAEPLIGASYGQAPVYHAMMLLVPETTGRDEVDLTVGPSCRICQRTDCQARREPSILKRAV